jgi:thioredoxin reductase (NADPH)
MEQKTGAGHITSPHLASSDIGNRRHQIFPTLSEDQFDILMRYGERQRFAAGQVLFRQGDRHIAMYVIISGSIEVERGSALGSTIPAPTVPACSRRDGIAGRPRGRRHRTRGGRQ